MKPIRVAITGNICSGKSTVLKEMMNIRSDSVFYSCDEIAKKIPSVVFNPDRIFTNFKMLLETERAIHWQVFEYLKQEYERISNAVIDYKKIMYVEIPILFERGYELEFDKVIGVVFDKSSVGERLIQRNLSYENYLKRSRWQVPQDIIIAKSDFLITTNKQASIVEQCSAIDQYLRRLL